MAHVMWFILPFWTGPTALFKKTIKIMFTAVQLDLVMDTGFKKPKNDVFFFLYLTVVPKSGQPMSLELCHFWHSPTDRNIKLFY